MIDDNKELVFSRDQINDKVKELAREISEAYSGKDLVLVGVLNGVFMFMADLVRELTIPVQLDFIRLASYGSGSSSSGKITMSKDVELDLKGRDVLIVEDIADSGLTLDFLKKHLASLGPASIKICALIDKKERRTIPININFSGFEIDQGFLVGYGLDYNEKYRYLPNIYHLTQA
ncbi:MAG: hypoxanthine phosphoribosyltransferase [Deltaproteobacteria bacterium]|nr:hypoxanthine phosphoribosyltransferase [Deltaproteobacteria bacterium]